MSKLLYILFLALPIFGSTASGWNDYDLDIGDGYRVFRSNTSDISIGDSSQSIILWVKDYPGVGPVRAYDNQNEFILVKTAARTPRNLFKEDTFEEVDDDKTFYFTITKADDSVQGPFSDSMFTNHLSTIGALPPNWQRPSNPNVLLPLAGSLMFVAIAIPFMLIKFWPITFVLFATCTYLVFQLWRRKRMKAQSGRLDCP